LEKQRAKAAAVVAVQQAQDEQLQTYLGDMGELILRDRSPLPEASPDDAVSRLARAKTLTVLASLDPARKSVLLQFLVEAQLIQRVEKRAPIITLSGADLGYANLGGADLSDANLSDAQGVTKSAFQYLKRN
jgi:pentapeptide repeat protein